MRILFVIRDMVIGGAGKQLALTANALSQKGHEVFIYSYFGGENKHHLDSRVMYIAQDPVPKSKWKEYLFSVWHIRKQMKSIRPDIAISWRCNAGCFTVLAALGLPLKTVFSERTDPYMETSFLLKISSFICGFSDGGVFQTTRARDYFKRLRNKSVVIHNPVDEKLISCRKEGDVCRRKRIVHVARMYITQKRQDIMLESFKIFLQTHPDYTLSFYGDGPDIDFIKKRAEELEISDSITFWGSVQNVVEKIKDAKMLVLTSDYEGIPNVIIESFSAGVPVVSTDCSPGGARVLIDDGINGFIVPVRNPGMLAVKMSLLAESEDLVNTFSKEGLKKLRHFSSKDIFESWNNYLCRII
ncbi:MAG: glycosyltransferase [Candidatus Saccharibacteria bacterium]|nr:glycosyltransferase [Candidatus Saccharibacteria bacterium]